MSRARRWRPEVEALEDRTTLSTVMDMDGPLPPVVAPGRHAAHRHLVLRGEVDGSWQRVPTLPDTGTLQTLTGSGTVQPLGAVTAAGQLRTPGFILHGRTEGTLTLTAAGGSITVRLVGPVQPGFSAPPSTFHYTITAGKGKYSGASGGGTATLREQTGTLPFPCPPNAICAVPLVLAQTFTLTFGPAK